MQVDNLLTCREFSKKPVDDAIVVCDFKNSEDLGDEGTYRSFLQYDEDVGRVTKSTEMKISYPILVIFCSSIYLLQGIEVQSFAPISGVQNELDPNSIE